MAKAVNAVGRMAMGMISAISLVVAILPVEATTPESYFYYGITIPDDDMTTVCRVNLVDLADEVCIDLPQFSNYALSPDNRYLATVALGNGQIQITDLETQQTQSLELCQTFHEFLWDDDYMRSGTLLWSPDSQVLAFAAIAHDVDCNRNAQAHTYLYEPASEKLVNLTQSHPPVRSLITPASWSPDGEWLALYGAWSVSQSEEGYTFPDWGSVMVSRDGTDFFEFAPNHNTCRLLWSPDMAWLTSNTACFEDIGIGASLLFIPFNPVPFSNERRIDELISPLRFDWTNTGSWISSYGKPIWIDNTRVVVHRRIDPVTFGYLSAEQAAAYSSNALVTIDLTDFSETVLIDDLLSSEVVNFDNWLVIGSSQSQDLLMVDPKINVQQTIPGELIQCPISSGLRLTQAGDYAAILHACSPGEAPYIGLYTLPDVDLVWRKERPDEDHTLQLLGFSNSFERVNTID